MGVKMDMGKIREEHQARTWRLIQAAGVAIEKQNFVSPHPTEMAAAVVAAFHEQAKLLREEATRVSEDQKRGWKSTADSLRDCATRISATAVAIERYGLPDSPENVAPVEIVAQGEVTVSEPALAEDPVQLVTRGGLPESTGVFFGITDDGLVASTPELAEAAAEIVTEVFGDAVRAVIHEQAPPAPEYQIGDTVTVAGIEFTKIGNDPFGPSITTDPPAQENPFSGATKTWAEAKMPSLPVMQLSDDPSTWNARPAHTSVSQANMAAGCGMQWWLKYRRGAPGRPSWAMIGGQVLHKCVEHLELAAADLDVTPAYIRNLWSEKWAIEVAAMVATSPFPKDTWHASNKGKENEAWWAADGPEMVHRYTEWRAKMVAAGWQLLRLGDGAPLVEFEFMHEGAKGYIDSAWIHMEMRQLLILDLKSGSGKQADYFQLSTYGFALAALMGGIPDDVALLGAFWDARSGELGVKVDLRARHTWDETRMRLGAPAALDSAGIYIPNVNGGYGGCGSCAHKLSCPVGSRIGTAEVS